MKQKQLFEREVAMNLARVIRVSAVVIGLGFVTLVPRVCHAQAEINPDFYDEQPLTHTATSVEHHGIAKATHSSLVPSMHPDCKEGAGEQNGCSAKRVSVRTRRVNASLNATAPHRPNVSPTTKISSKANAQTTQESAGG
jgi:hypothetical protein